MSRYFLSFFLGFLFVCSIFHFTYFSSLKLTIISQFKKNKGVALGKEPKAFWVLGKHYLSVTDSSPPIYFLLHLFTLGVLLQRSENNQREEGFSLPGRSLRLNSGPQAWSKYFYSSIHLAGLHPHVFKI